MFEIGSSLRQAREKRGLELDAVQRALRIRRRYLEAIENDRFDQLPGEVYARGFLREYADFLGLDGSIYVEEYNARFAPREEHPIAVKSSTRALRPQSSGRAVAVAVLAAITVAVGIAAWRLGGGASPPRPTQAAQTVRTRPARSHVATRVTRTAAKSAVLSLTAVRGDCWVGVRLGSRNGRMLYWQTLPRGSTIRFGLRRPLWLRVGDGQNLDATVAGKPLAGLPQVTGDLLVRA
jgi:cytoskeletal protein RodZ